MKPRQGRLAGKKALVTAAGQGIGRASVEQYVAEGAEVIACAINEDTLTELSAINGVSVIKLDVTDADAVAGAIASVGELDVLFNCAGFVGAGNILECDEAQWAFSFDLNVKAMFRLAKLVIPGMVAKGGGSIVTMSSVASSIVGVPN